MKSPEQARAARRKRQARASMSPGDTVVAAVAVSAVAFLVLVKLAFLALIGWGIFELVTWVTSK